MQVIEGLNEIHLRPDRKLHPLVETWIGWRQMYMNNATYDQALIGDGYPGLWVPCEGAT